ncbi:MAG TPA: aldose 1-epimerase [Candidatus Acidoferrum sp.]|nr:aldose 1-epimerase [Candidatus Acidoferrum sp.]
MNDPTAHRLAAGDLDAWFLPRYGMLGASLRWRGVELLRRVEDLDAAAAKGSTAGIPLLYPWANRLAGPRYQVAGRAVVLDPDSSLLHWDDQRLPMHGVPWALLPWEVSEATVDRLVGRLDWGRKEWLAIFPFPHQLEMRVSIAVNGLTIETTLIAGEDSLVPVSFGFHPYFGIPGVPRAHWRLRLPAMRRLVPGPQGIPTDKEEDFAETDALLGESGWDHGFGVKADNPVFSIAGAGLRISLECLGGYRFAQIFAPPDKDYIALEPMTAPSNALASGRGLTFVEAGRRFHAAFRIQVDPPAKNLTVP